MSRTADVLGVERSNLYRKMRAFGIAPDARRDESRARTATVGEWRDMPRAASDLRSEAVLQHATA